MAFMADPATALAEKEQRDAYDAAKRMHDGLKENQDILEDAVATGAVSIRRTADGVAVDLGGGAVLDGLNADQAVSAAHAIAKDPKAADVLGLMAEGWMPQEDVEDRLSGLLYLQDAWAGLSQSGGQMNRHKTPDDEAELEALKQLALEQGFGSLAEVSSEIERLAALNVGLGALNDGKSLTEASDAALVVLNDDGSMTDQERAEFIGSFVPYVGQGIALKDAAQEAGAFGEAYGNGDVGGMLGSGAGMVLAGAGAVPGVGALSKGAKTLGRIATGTRLGHRVARRVQPTVDKLTAQAKLQRGKRQFNRFENMTQAQRDKTFPKSHVKTDFDAVLATMPNDTRKHFEAAYKNMVGQAGEANATNLLRQAGFGVPDRKNVSRHMDVDGDRRVADELVVETPETWLGLFMGPGKPGEKLTAIEHKINHSQLTKRQGEIDDKLNGVGQMPKTGTTVGEDRVNAPVEGMIHLRERLDQIPFETLEQKMRGVMIKATDKQGNLLYKPDQINALVDQAKTLHAASAKSENGITFFQFMAVTSASHQASKE